MGLFGPSRPLTADEMSWQLAGFKWLIKEFGDADQPLIDPLGDYFADSDSEGEQRGAEIFDEVKAIMGIADWPTMLQPVDDARGPQYVSPTIILQPIGPSAAGTFQMMQDDSGETLALIHYQIGQVADPTVLVATFAHELSHYRLAYRRHEFPGGDEVHELMTDLTAVYFGFGLFLGNSARDHVPYQDGLTSGWNARWQGYLSERAIMTAMAISETLAGRDPLAKAHFLKPYLRKDLDVAAKWLAKRDIRAAIDAIDLSQFGVVPIDD